MSCDEANVSAVNLEKLEELTNKLNRCNKHVKLVFGDITEVTRSN